MPNCTILIGPPGAGKSTWVSKCDYDFEVISTDMIIEKIALDYGLTYSDIFKDSINLATKIMNLRMQEYASKKVDVVIDRTNMSISARKKFINLFRGMGYTIDAIVFPIPEDWENRLNNRPGKIIPKDVLNSMIENFEFPRYEEGFTNIWTIDEL